jgi:hypothetical protein
MTSNISITTTLSNASFAGGLMNNFMNVGVNQPFNITNMSITLNASALTVSGLATIAQMIILSVTNVNVSGFANASYNSSGMFIVLQNGIVNVANSSVSITQNNKTRVNTTDTSMSYKAGYIGIITFNVSATVTNSSSSSKITVYSWYIGCIIAQGLAL